MKRIAIITSLVWISYTFQMCQQKQQDNTSADSAVANTSAQTSGAEISQQLMALGLTQEGHWRGISLGDSITKVTAMEKAQLFEKDANHLGYSVEFANLESMDVLYYQDSKQLISAIDVDLYLNTQQSVTSYVNDLTSYFTSRYGNPTKREKELIWTGPKQEQISLKDVSKGKDFGVKVKVSDE